MKLRIHTQGWVADHSKQPGEEASGSIYVLLEIDGHVIHEVSRVAVVTSSDAFTKVVATLIPGELETVVHDQESWEDLIAPRRSLYKRWLESRRRPPP